MNVGGGILLRTVARAAGSAAGANPVVTPAASTGFCSACTGQLTRPSTLRTTCRHATLSQQASSAQQLEFEDWEFAEDALLPNPDSRLVFGGSTSCREEDPTAAASDYCWHVFGLPPSFDEAKEAASELQAALVSAHISPTVDIESTSSSSLTFEYGSPFTPPINNDEDNDAEQQPQCGSTEWVEPQLFMSECGMVQVARNPVHEAFQLLQSDPNVKGAVISIVSDPDVWHAMMKNEKVQELKRIFQESQGSGKGEPDFSSAEQQSHVKHDWTNGVSDLLHLIIGKSKQVISKVQEDISRIIRSIFALLSKGCQSEKSDPFDKTLRSSMMLAVLVLAVVLIKRVQA